MSPVAKIIIIIVIIIYWDTLFKSIYNIILYVLPWQPICTQFSKLFSLYCDMYTKFKVIALKVRDL